MPSRYQKRTLEAPTIFLPISWDFRHGDVEEEFISHFFFWHRVLLRARLTRAGQSSPSAQMGWIGRSWLARPSKGHDGKFFLGIFYFSTGQKVSRKPKFGSTYHFVI